MRTALAAWIGLSSFAAAQTPLGFPTLVWPIGRADQPLELVDVDRDGALDCVTFGPLGVECHPGDGHGGFRRVKAFAAGLSGPAFEPVDLDGDGWLDLIVATQAGLAVCRSDLAGGTEPATFVSAELVHDLATADFNSDGQLDLVGWAPQVSSVLVVLSSPTGFDAALSLPFASGSDVPLACGDFDGDGAADVALALFEPLTGKSRVVVQLGRGDGTFAQRVAFDGNFPVMLHAADFDGDGTHELVAKGQADIEVHRHVGNGRFRSQRLSDVRPWRGLRVADIDGDGALDIASLAPLAYPARDETIVVFSADALGNFSARSTLFTCEQATDFAVGDLDLDGVSDFLTSRLGGGICVTLGLAPLEVVGPVPTGLPRCAATLSGDLDGDGDVDLFAIGWKSCGSFLNEGQNGFVERARVGFEERPYPFELVDVDADGDLDCVGRTTSASRTCVFTSLNDGTGRFAAPLFSAFPRLEDEWFGDVDGDGVNDLVQVASGVVVRRGDGSGGYLAPIVTSITSLTGRSTLADLDGDGRVDLIALGAFGGIEVHLGLASGSFGPALVTPLAANARVVLAGHFDADSRLDLAVIATNERRIVRALGDGAGGFHSFTSTPMARPHGLESTYSIARFDSDGLDDVLIATSAGELPSGFARTWIYRADASTGFTRAVEVAVPTQSFSHSIGDFDLDGRTDLVFRSDATLRFELHLQR